jgi:hypothetical protein
VPVLGTAAAEAARQSRGRWRRLRDAWRRGKAEEPLPSLVHNVGQSVGRRQTARRTKAKRPPKGPPALVNGYVVNGMTVPDMTV